MIAKVVKKVKGGEIPYDDLSVDGVLILESLQNIKDRLNEIEDCMAKNGVHDLNDFICDDCIIDRAIARDKETKDDEKQ